MERENNSTGKEMFKKKKIEEAFSLEKIIA